MHTADDTQTLITQVLDDIKARHNLRSNYALAQFLKVPDIYISRWYNGEYGPATVRCLAPQLVEFGRRSSGAQAA